jgi:hypothetical protein
MHVSTIFVNFIQFDPSHLSKLMYSGLLTIKEIQTCFKPIVLIDIYLA